MTDQVFGFGNRSLSSKIFNSVLVFSLFIILVLSVVITTIFYFSYEQEAESELVRQAQNAADTLNTTSALEWQTELEAQFGGWIRYTLIDADGEVRFDSTVEPRELENHADRPEVRAASELGQATTVRYSDTLKTDTVYAAIRLDDGSVIRLAETRHSLLIFLTDMVVPVLVALIVVAILVFIFSRFLTRRIMRPIDALDFAEPLQNEIYEEMTPLLVRIDDQQKQLKQQNEDLARAESMRRDFSSNVSHEMKTPLQVISGYAELMENDMVQAADRQRFAGLIYEEAQSMRHLIDDVLMLSELDESGISDKDQKVDLYAVAKRATERLRDFAQGEGITIDLKGESAIIVGSETITEQMIYNLLENGIRYNHPGGSVYLSITPGQNEHLMRIQDTGYGIPVDMQDKIFERFFRVDKSRSKETGGTGLGLAIVKHAVLYHGGDIYVESEVGKGTLFTICFPVDKTTL